jgi:hypothetical protein
MRKCDAAFGEEIAGAGVIDVASRQTGHSAEVAE